MDKLLILYMIRPKTRLRRVSKLIINFVLISYYIRKLARYVHRLELNADTINAIVNMMEYITVLSCYLTLIWNATGLFRLLDKGSEYAELSPRSVTLLSFLFPVCVEFCAEHVYWYWFGTDVYIQFYLYDFNIVKLAWYHYFLFEAALIFHEYASIGWFQFTTIFYRYSVLQLNNVVKKYLMNQLSCAKKSRKLSNLAESRLEWHRICEYRKELNSKLCAWPMLWMIYLFMFYTVQIVTFYLSPKTDVINLLWLAVITISRIVPVFRIIFVDSKLSKQNKLLLMDVLLALKETRESIECFEDKTCFIVELSEKFEFSFTGLNFFRFDKSLIVAFLGSVTSFSVLFAQYIKK